MLKKLLCCALTALLVLPALPVHAAAAPAGELKIAVASDLHYNLPEETLTRYTDDPVFGHANRRAALENESGYIIDSFLADCEAKAVDYVLISGDMADHGRSVPAEHHAVRDKLAAFERRTGIPVLVIDGNHDLGENSETGISEFKEIYADLGYDLACAARAEDCSYAANLGDAYRLIALDSCDPAVSTEDGMNAAKLRWAVQQAKLSLADGRYPLLMMHHNLLDHLPAQRVFSHNFIVRNHTLTAQLFADAGIKVVLTGHEHCSDAAVYTSPAGNVLCDFATTSLTMYPLSYRLFTFSAEQIEYEAVNIAQIDVSALAAATAGYTAAIREAMGADLTAFSKQFLKKGVAYRLRLSLSAEKSDLSPDSAIYRLLDTLYAELLALLDMPLYGGNGAAALAESYGINIPVTPYETGWDLATEFVAAHYAGSEAFDLTGPEVTALLRLAALTLRCVPAGTAASLYESAALRLVPQGAADDLKSLCRAAFGGVTPGEYLAAALVSDLVYGFTNDADGLDDNNGAVAPYGQTDRAAALEARFVRFFRRLITALQNFFAVLIP